MVCWFKTLLKSQLMRLKSFSNIVYPKQQWNPHLKKKSDNRHYIIRNKNAMKTNNLQNYKQNTYKCGIRLAGTLASPISQTHSYWRLLAQDKLTTLGFENILWEVIHWLDLLHHLNVDTIGFHHARLLSTLHLYLKIVEFDRNHIVTNTEIN